ncbi:MAG: A/G-specific adenine glycosylase [Verrucomicrobia bacterium]|nr:A/G-specific adenine glycosylase [Verrucomicrobiota bacterium]
MSIESTVARDFLFDPPLPGYREPMSADRFIVSSMLQWYAEHARDLPWRRTQDPYAIWISEIMLQQTQVKTVLPYWTRWMRRLPDIASLARSRTETVLKLWAGLGYYSRARNLKRAAELILQNHDGEFPRDPGIMAKLPGIGRYTTGAICSIAFNQPTPILDGNVIRVLTRFFGILEDSGATTTRTRLWKIAGQLVTLASTQGIGLKHTSTTRHCADLNQSLMELGALICSPREPNCGACPLQARCAAHRANMIPQIPALKPKAAMRSRLFVAFAISRDGCFLVQKRSEGGVNAQLWEFPNAECLEDEPDPENSARLTLGLELGASERIGTIRHTITRNRIRLEVYHSKPSHDPSGTSPLTRWCPPSKLAQLPFPSAHRKIVELLANRQLLRT